MKIAICDDDREFLCYMTKVLQQITEGLDITIRSYAAGEELWADYQQNKARYDVVFMDILLKGMDGITLGKQLKELDEDMLLILLTNYPEYAVKGYEAKAFRYLLKPVDEARMKHIFAEIQQERSRKQLLQISADGEEMLVSLAKIQFLEAKEKYTTIYLEGESYLSRKSLNEYEQQLNGKGFCRIHRKYLVNLKNIRKWKARQIEIGEHVLHISRRRERAFSEQFYGYLEKGIEE